MHASYRLHVDLDLPVTAPVVPWTFKGITQAHVVAGTTRRVHLPALFDMIVFKETSMSPWDWRGFVQMLVYVDHHWGETRRTVGCRIGGGAHRVLSQAR